MGINININVYKHPKKIIPLIPINPTLQRFLSAFSLNSCFMKSYESLLIITSKTISKKLSFKHAIDK